MTERFGRNAPCPCGSGKKYKKCHGAPAASVREEREIYGAFGLNPLRETAQRRPPNDLQAVLARIMKEKEVGARILPSRSLISVGEIPPDDVRRFLVDTCATLVDENWCGRSEMCIYFAVLLRHGLRQLGYAADVEIGEGQYFGAAQPFTWSHAWVRTSVGDLVDGNVDSLVENPIVPTGVNPAPYWGPAESLPKDRRLSRDRVFGPECDGTELDEREITAWKASLEKAILEWQSRRSGSTA